MGLPPCPVGEDPRRFLCRRMGLEAAAERFQDVEILYGQHGKQMRPWPVQNRHWLDSRGTVYELRLPEDLRLPSVGRQDDHEGGMQLSDEWHSAGQEWSITINFNAHPLARSCFNLPMCSFQGRTLREPREQQWQCQGAEALCCLKANCAVTGRHYQLALWEHLQKLEPDLELRPMDATRSKFLLSYMQELPVVFEVELPQRQRSHDLCLLLATEIRGEWQGPWRKTPAPCKVLGFVVPHDFTRALANQELDRLRGQLHENDTDLTGQIALISDIDHTILQSQFLKSEENHLLPNDKYHLMAANEQRWCTREGESADFSICFEEHGVRSKAIVYVRAAIDEFLKLVAGRRFKISLMTAGTPDYAAAVIQGLQLWVEDPRHTRHLVDKPELIAAARSVFDPSRVVSVFHIHVFIKEHQQKFGLGIGPKSFKQVYVFASFEEQLRRRLIGVDDKVDEVDMNCGDWYSNYDLESSSQVLRIRMQHRCDSQAHSHPCWAQMRCRLLELHTKMLMDPTFLLYTEVNRYNAADL